MNFLKQKQNIIIFFCSMTAVFSIAYISYRVLATEATNINSESKYAWSENAGWLNFASENGGVMVNDADLTGYIWSENLGWISLNCSNNNSCATSNYKIANNNEGNLSGYAWSDTVGWINFAPANGGVDINSSGEFSGYAWGENIGWIIFNCGDVDSCDIADFKVKTTWLPLSIRNQNTNEEQDGVNISDIHYSSTDTTITISWDTNHNADSHIHYGRNKNLEKEKNDNDNEKKHRIVLRELESNTEYFFRVKSVDSDDNSDSSRIYSIKTKTASAVFVKHQWENFNEEKENGNNYEKVNIDITDKSDTELKKNEDENKTKETSEIKIPEQKSSVISGFFAWFKGNISDSFLRVRELALDGQGKIIGFFTRAGEEKNKKEEEIKKSIEIAQAKIIENENKIPSMSEIFSPMEDGISGFFSGVRELALGGQREIIAFFGWTSNQIAIIHDSFVSKFNKEKANQIARVNQAKFFTTQVFSRDEKKMLAEVKFQILDKSDNPIPHLETMLFSDPQTSVTDDNGIASFKDVPLGSHTLAFDYQGENFEKKVAIADTLTDEGKVRAEVVQVKAEKEKIAMWMWGVIFLLVIVMAIAVYFALKYYKLKKTKQRLQ